MDQEETNPVRRIQHHLRRAAALLAEHDFDAASRAVQDALAIDAASLPAQALQQRIDAARERPVAPAVAPPRERFVPCGVDAQSWIGFEARIQERRYRALLVAVNAALASGDGPAARVALDEARELRPQAPELRPLTARVALLPLTMTTPDPASATVWSRAFGAVALLCIGVAFVIGIEWLRPAHAPAASAAVTQPLAQQAEAADLQPPVSAGPVSAGPTVVARTAPAAERLPAEAPVAAPVHDTDAVGTVGVEHVATAEESGRAAATRPSSFPPPPVVDAPAPPDGEIPDNYVAASPRRESGAIAPLPSLTSSPAPAIGPGPAPYANVARQPSSIVSSPAPAAAVATPAAVPAVASRTDESRVAQVLNRYAHAYGTLDASAAHAVWPSVDERALARAFSSLASQNIAFDGCDINVSGTTASASCRGRASYVAKVGSREPRSEARTWQFELRRDGDAWTIENAEAH
jgi:hypothetical protein